MGPQLNWIELNWYKGMQVAHPIIAPTIDTKGSEKGPIMVTMTMTNDSDSDNDKNGKMATIETMEFLLMYN